MKFSRTFRTNHHRENGEGGCGGGEDDTHHHDPFRLINTIHLHNDDDSDDRDNHKIASRSIPSIKKDYLLPKNIFEWNRTTKLIDHNPHFDDNQSSNMPIIQSLALLLKIISVISAQQSSHNRFDYDNIPYYQQNQSPQSSWSKKSSSSFDLPNSFDGGEIEGRKVFIKRNNDGMSLTKQADYIINTDIIVKRKSQLIIEPGVRLAFKPGIGIDVFGSLNATVSSNFDQS
ncbi:hypothetical protein QR98_0036100 [Sarcoptes scabiei]|uniref:Uncharacterized protein n=1 Tax=Sarcoptes scabiei TaxID=52283 RepID=A0A132A2I4_SARSC|nr:hypothetical protein QR98_0036100 [Sarcoptes scabiei]